MEFKKEDVEEEEEEEESEVAITPTFKTQQQPTCTTARYRECLKNHAVGIGGHALDGCREFMPAGADGSLDALRCAACNCNRNFHRKELTVLDSSVNTTSSSFNHQLTLYAPRPCTNGPQIYQFYPYTLTTGSGGGEAAAGGGYVHRNLAPPGNNGGYYNHGQEVGLLSGGGGVTSGGFSGKKRNRTKFTQEQKDKMMCLAESIGWKIQKQDEGVLQKFCDETGVQRNVFKVWMHNNKHSLGKKP